MGCLFSHRICGIAGFLGVLSLASGCGGSHHHHHEVVVEVEDHDHPTKVRVDRPAVVVERPAQVVVSTEIVVQTAPPPPRVEVIPRAPGRDYVWIDGCWRHDGQRFVWVTGRYVRESKGERHVAAHWESTSRGWVFHPERVEPGESRRPDARRDRRSDDARGDTRRDDEKRRRDARTENQRRASRTADDDDDRRQDSSGSETKRPR